ncbi:SOUL family heme-binding protein [Natronobacterium gregoryi]|uniref:Heme-binding protein n=2 Tax=Natronobacterium gregoryi TaxID=44930 RepID=L0AFB0_NATGS|nr:heme-binding protein [Natronobacterium gregoryi]AFZ72526.1 SOUL heme-binding protein [Natronobacterium gregoryi SP2]ELY74399.1 SOUL heme-binding protein [Natronobacterium gregoryi SP2]PLK21495.1 heme-binding protein [Natronobacterium gregoryi SP2]SFI76416.1 SOUL heme-binding protein [Natronobacterium gregoryi]
MARKSSLDLALAGGLVGVAGMVTVSGLWSLYQRRTTETVPYTVVDRAGGFELRRYPPTVLAETTADSDRKAFRRLFRYIGGENESAESVSMTTPVELGTRSQKISMTAPVETASSDDGTVRMAFYLPQEHDLESAPQPTSEEVELVAAPERLLAVRRFSGRRTDDRVTRESERLLASLERAGLTAAREPFYMGYDAPWTLPFLRRNEVATRVASGKSV